jgi:hypothetical protein
MGNKKGHGQGARGEEQERIKNPLGCTPHPETITFQKY